MTCHAWQLEGSIAGQRAVAVTVRDSLTARKHENVEPDSDLAGEMSINRE
jgi:hypothetical protein